MKRLLLLLLLATPTWAATPSVVDSCEVGTTGTSATCSVDTAQGDRVYATCGWNNAANFVSLTHNGDAMEEVFAPTVGEAAQNNEMGGSRRVSPDIGSALDVVCTISGSQAIVMIVVVVSNSNVGTPNDAGVITDPGVNGTGITADITSEVGDLVLEWTMIGLDASADSSTLTQGADQTTIQDITDGGDNMRMWSSYQAGANPATMSSGWGNSMGRIQMAINLNASTPIIPVLSTQWRQRRQ